MDAWLPSEALLVVRTWRDGARLKARITLASGAMDSPVTIHRVGVAQVRDVVTEWLTLLEIAGGEGG